MSEGPDPVEAAQLVSARIEAVKLRLPPEVFNPLLAELDFEEMTFEFEPAPMPVTVTYTPYDPEREAFIERVVELYHEQDQGGPAQPHDFLLTNSRTSSIVRAWRATPRPPP